MMYLNLTDGFNPHNALKTNTIKHEKFFFSGGEPHIKIDSDYAYAHLEDVTVTSRLNNMDDFMLLMVALDALYSIGRHNHVYLFIPYFPGARQDRQMVAGEPLTVKLFADILNLAELNDIEVFDAHSDVAPAVLDNCDNVNNHLFVHECLQKIFE